MENNFALVWYWVKEAYINRRYRRQPRQKANVDPDDDSQESYALIKAEQYKAKEHFFYLFNKWFYHLGI